MTTPLTLNHSKSLSSRHAPKTAGVGHWLAVGGAVAAIGAAAALIAFAL